MNDVVSGILYAGDYLERVETTHNGFKNVVLIIPSSYNKTKESLLCKRICALLNIKHIPYTSNIATSIDASIFATGNAEEVGEWAKAEAPVADNAFRKDCYKGHLITVKEAELIKDDQAKVSGAGRGGSKEDVAMIVANALQVQEQDQEEMDVVARKDADTFPIAVIETKLASHQSGIWRCGMPKELRQYYTRVSQAASRIPGKCGNVQYFTSNNPIDTIVETLFPEHMKQVKKALSQLEIQLCFGTLDNLTVTLPFIIDSLGRENCSILTTNTELATSSSLSIEAVPYQEDETIPDEYKNERKHVLDKRDKRFSAFIDHIIKQANNNICILVGFPNSHDQAVQLDKELQTYGIRKGVTKVYHDGEFPEEDWDSCKDIDKIRVMVLNYLPLTAPATPTTGTPRTAPAPPGTRSAPTQARTRRELRPRR